MAMWAPHHWRMGNKAPHQHAWTATMSAHLSTHKRWRQAPTSARTHSTLVSEQMWAQDDEQMQAQADQWMNSDVGPTPACTNGDDEHPPQHTWTVTTSTHLSMHARTAPSSPNKCGPRMTNKCRPRLTNEWMATWHHPHAWWVPTIPSPLCNTWRQTSLLFCLYNVPRHRLSTHTSLTQPHQPLRIDPALPSSCQPKHQEGSGKVETTNEGIYSLVHRFFRSCLYFMLILHVIW